MPIGDDAASLNYPLVSGADAAKNGDDEINATRDMIARVQKMIPVGKAAYRTAAGITYGTTDPSNSSGSDGDIYFKIVG